MASTGETCRTTGGARGRQQLACRLVWLRQAACERYVGCVDSGIATSWGCTGISSRLWELGSLGVVQGVHDSKLMCRNGCYSTTQRTRQGTMWTTRTAGQLGPAKHPHDAMVALRRPLGAERKRLGGCTKAVGTGLTSMLPSCSLCLCCTCITPYGVHHMC